MKNKITKTPDDRIIGNSPDSRNYVLSAENEIAKITVIAEGLPCSENGGAGAKTACESIADAILNEAEFIFTLSPAAVARLITDYVNRQITETAIKLNIFPNSMATTLCFVCLNRKTGTAVTFTLGDSLIYSLSRKKKLSLLSKVKMSLYDEPYSAVTPQAYRYADVAFIPPDSDCAELILATGGAWRSFYLDGTLTDTAQTAAANGQLTQYLSSKTNGDYAVVTFLLPNGVNNNG